MPQRWVTSETNNIFIQDIGDEQLELLNVTIAQLCRDTFAPDHGNYSVLPACDCPGSDNDTAVVDETCQFTYKADDLSLWRYLVILN